METPSKEAIEAAERISRWHDGKFNTALLRDECEYMASVVQAAIDVAVMGCYEAGFKNGVMSVHHPESRPEQVASAEIEVQKSEKWALEKALVKAEGQLNEAKSFLRRYQTRYHGAEHAQKLWNEVDVFLNPQTDRFP